MRLTDEVLLAADKYMAESVGQAVAVAAGGRFGLFTPTRPFQLSLSITRGFVEVEALSCLAVTGSGDIIDVQFDTQYSNTFDTRVQIPNNEDAKEYFLIIIADPDSFFGCPGCFFLRTANAIRIQQFPAFSFCQRTVETGKPLLPF